MKAPFVLAGVSLAMLLTAALLTLGCAGKESLNPNEQKPAPTDAGPPDAPPDAEPVTPVRQVMTRNPLGGPPQNLLADGDFEMSVVTSDRVGGQYGWIGATQDGGQVGFDSETGGTCRSGIRCAHAAKGIILYGRGTAAPAKQKIDATIWLKAVGPDAEPDPTKVCKKLATIYLVQCDNPGLVWANVKAPDVPSSDGWCQFSALAAGSDLALCMYVDLAAEVLADSAVMLPSLSQKSLSPFSLADGPSAAEREKVRVVMEAIRKRTPFDTGSRAAGSEQLELLPR